MNEPPEVTLVTVDQHQFYTATPTLEFTGADPESDDITYEFGLRNYPEERILDENLTYSTNESLYSGKSIIGQRIVGNGKYLTKARVYIRRQSSTASSVIDAVLYETGSGGSAALPAGSPGVPLAVSSNAVNNSQLLNSALYSSTYFYFDSPQLELGKKYVIALRCDGAITSSGSSSVVGTSNSGTGSENLVYFGTSWSDASSVDLCFQAFTVDKPYVESSICKIDSGGWSTGTTGVNAGPSRAQSFTALRDGNIYHVYSVIMRSGAPSDRVRLSIYADSAGEPGSLLGTSGVEVDLSTQPTAGSLFPGGGAFTNSAIYPSTVIEHRSHFSFSPGVSVAEGIRYWVVWERTGSPDNLNYFSVLGTNNGNHLGESGRVWNGTSWAATSMLSTYLLVTSTAADLSALSALDAGFVNEDDGGDTDPFTSGEQIGYTLQAGDALDEGDYYWRVRGKDPAGTNDWGDWTESRQFSVDLSSPTPVVATPTTAALTLTPFAPTVSATNHRLVTPTMAGLAVALFAPTVTRTEHHAVMPGPATVAVAGNAPTASSTDHQLITNASAELSMTAYAPTVSATDYKAVTPTPASLATTTHAPTATATDHQLVTPTTASLSMTPLAPTVSASASQVATPDVETLSTSAFAPSVAITEHQTAVPAFVGLALTSYSPVIISGIRVTPSTVDAALTPFAASVVTTNHQIGTPAAQALSTSTSAPSVTVSDHKLATPGHATLTVAVSAPTVTASDAAIPTPTTVSLAISTFPALLQASDHQLVTPATSVASVAPYAPTVSATDHLAIAPTTASLSTTEYASSVAISDHKLLDPDVATVALVGFTPDIEATHHVFVIPAVVALALEVFPPGVHDGTWRAGDQPPAAVFQVGNPETDSAIWVPGNEV